MATIVFWIKISTSKPVCKEKIFFEVYHFLSHICHEKTFWTQWHGTMLSPTLTGRVSIHKQYLSITYNCDMIESHSTTFCHQCKDPMA